MTSPFSRRIAVAVAVLAAAVSSPARAGVIGAGDTHSDPVFTGPDVTYAAAAGSAFRIVTHGGGVGRRWALSIPQLGAASAGIRLAGAGQDRVLVHTVGAVDRFSPIGQDSLVLAPSRGRGATLAGCGSRLAVDADAFAGDDGRAVYAPSACQGDASQRVIVRRHDNGAETELAVDPRHRVSHVRLAGRYVAFTDFDPAENATTLRVFDSDAGTQTTALTESGSTLSEFALTDDGTVALCREAQIIEFPLGGGSRVLPGSQCEGPLVAGDVGYLSVLTGTGAQDSVLAAYSGGRNRTVARLFGEVRDQGAPAMRGRLVAFRRRFCGGWEVVTANVGAPAARAESRCGGQIAGRPQRIRRGTALRVPVRCPDGCTATVSISTSGHPETRRSTIVDLPRRGTRRVTLPLTRAAQRSRVQVRLAVQQPPAFSRARTVDRAVAARP